MNSNEYSTNLHPETVKHLKSKSKLELGAGLLGFQRLQDEADRQKRNIEAEDAAVRQTMGWNTDSQDSEGDEMRQTVLGDIHNPPPVVINGGNEKRSLLGPLAAVALGALIPGAGIAGYVASQYLTEEATPVINQTLDRVKDVSLGLGRIEDYE